MQLFNRSVSSGPGVGPTEPNPAKEQQDDESSCRLGELKETMEEIRKSNPGVTAAAHHQLAIQRMAERRRESAAASASASFSAIPTAKDLLRRAGEASSSTSSGGALAEPPRLRSVFDQVRSGFGGGGRGSGNGNGNNASGATALGRGGVNPLGDGLRSASGGGQPQYLMRRESHRDPFLNVNRAELMKELSGLDLDDSSASSGEPASRPGLAAGAGVGASSDRSLELRDIEGGAAEAAAARPNKNEGGGDGTRAGAAEAAATAAATGGVVRGHLGRRRSSVRIRRGSGVSLRSIREIHGPGDEAGEEDDGSGSGCAGSGRRNFDDSLDGSGDLVIDDGALICQWRRNSGISVNDVRKSTSNDDSLSDVSDGGLICGWRSRRMSDLSVGDDFNASAGSSGLSAD